MLFYASKSAIKRSIKADISYKPNFKTILLSKDEIKTGNFSLHVLFLPSEVANYNYS
jgi:hypothetical protein